MKHEEHVEVRIIQKQQQKLFPSTGIMNELLKPKVKLAYVSAYLTCQIMTRFELFHAHKSEFV
jgi:hypothetical protein